LKLKEERNKAKEKVNIHQQRIQRWFDKHVAGDKQFQVGELVLKWDKSSKAKGKHSKLQKLWLGPYEITEKIGEIHIDYNLCSETWKTSLLMLLS
jgi:hypothetical protein